MRGPRVSNHQFQLSELLRVVDRDFSSIFCTGEVGEDAAQASTGKGYSH